MIKKILFIIVVALSLILKAKAQTYTVNYNGNVTSCSGTVYDAGGATGNYGNSQTYVFTICSGNGQPVYLQFSQFQLESNYDYVYLYNGPNITSPAIGTYTGSNSPGTVTASSGCITIRFTSDGSVTYAGFAATIGCGTPPPPPPPPPPPSGNCAGAQPFCTGTNYSFPASTGTTAQVGPNYGCLLTQPNPVWYYLQIATNGSLTIPMSSSPAVDIDFALWGPFNSLTNICNQLTGTPISCSYSTASTETATITNAVAGQFYMLVITNYSNSPTNISFNQSGGTGTTNCAILCNINSITATPGACVPATNTYSVTGTLTTFAPPSTGTLTISSSCGGSVTYNPPFSSTLNYTVPNITANGASCTITASYSADPQCTRTITYTAPASCSSCASTAVPTQPTCTTSTGSILVTATSGNAGFNVSWSGPSTGNPGGTEINALNGTYTIPNLAPGTYTVTVTASGGCTSVNTVTINAQPTTPNAGFTSSANQCLTGNSFSFTSAQATGTHSWSFGASATPTTSTVANPTGVTFSAAGTYPITHTITASGCTSTVTQNVTIYPQPAVTLTPTNVNCNGASTGSITSAVTGGTAGFTYAWTPTTATGANPSGLPAGSYSVIVTDANNCTATANTTITQPTALTATTSQVNVLCNGAATGTATVTPSGGTGPYTYLWNTTPNQTTATATGLVAGSYSVTITDSRGCVITRTFTITQPTGMTLSTTQVNPGCGLSNGSATATVSGGATPYTYSWTPTGGTGANTATYTNIAAGGYTITVTDANGCQRTATVTLSNPASPTATTTQVNVGCNGASTGSASVTATGGTGTYTYTWSPAGGTGANTSTYSNLAAGTYSVTVTDGANCVATQTVTITQPTVLSGAVTATTSPICTASNGSITVVASGGTPGYTYSWNTTPVQTTATASNLPAGSYTLTITDTRGCTRQVTQALTATGSMTATVTGTNVNCFGGTTGSVTTTVNTGTSPYSYLWNNSATAQNLSNLAAGTYSVTITDANGCTTTGSYTVTQPAAALAATTSQVNVSCNGGTNGTATVNASGGTAPYTYSWNTTPVQTTATASGLAAGTYTYTVTDTRGCIVTNTVTITQPTLVTGSATTTAAACGATNGTATVTAGGGTGPYTYSWSPSGGTNATAINLAGGSYTVTITDALGCTRQVSATVATTAAATATIASSTNVSCNGGNNGSATVSVTGGTSPYTYAWTPTGGTAATATGLTANTYTVTVTDANSCTSQATVTITQPTALAGTVAVNANVTCNGGSNGSLTVTASGGTSPYTYSWSPSGGSGTTASGLAAGTYTVTITDTKNCITTATGTITQPLPISVATNTVSATCGNANGSATTTITNGTAPYTYSWNTTPVQTGSSASNLAGGSYTVNVTDANGCTGTGTANVNNIAGPSASITTSVNVSCNGGSDGSATVAGSGGTAPYTYSWNTTPVQTTATATNLAAGSYAATVTDANNCVSNINVTINQPAALTSTISTTTNVSCNGGTNGSATVTAAGGTPGYTYSWLTTPSQTTATATGLAAGSYTVNITDIKGCITSSTATITQPPVLSLIPSNTNVTCNGGSNGTASVIASGGTPGYSYSWSPSGGSSNSATGLTAGTYTVTVTDLNGCIRTQTINITQPPAITTTQTKTDVSCNGGSNGSATVTPTGGTLPYTYAWAPTGGTGATANNLIAGTYTVTVTDANNCTGTATITIAQPTVLAGAVTPVNILCNGVCNGQASVTASGGTSPYTYLWNDPNLQTTTTATGLCAGNFSVQITDAKNCTTTVNTAISQPVAITLSTTTVPSNCNQSDGSATVTVANGTAPFTYSWTPAGGTGANTATYTNIASGVYTVTVTDANGCQKTTTANVNNTGSPTVSISSSGNVSCNGGSNGFANASVSGGTPPYNYVWSTTPVQTTSAASNLPAGTYNLVITDPNGCTANTSVTITEPAVLNGAITPQTNVSCNGGSNGSATIIPSGGTGPYTYVWTAPGSPTTATVNNLAAGNYTVTITDNNNCIRNVPLTITQPPAIVVTLSNTTSYCNLALGSATATVANGTAPYTYNWSNTATGATASNLTPGSYTVNVLDLNGCTGTGSTTVGNVPAGTATLSATTDVSCAGGADGTATVSMGGGTAPYTYLWSNNQTGITASGLAAGNYSVTVTDNNGCTASASATINDPTALAVTLSLTNATCNNTCNGAAAAITSGGTAPYTYLWTDPLAQTTGTASNLCAGPVSVTITDAKGCDLTLSGVINQPSAIALSETHIDATCGQSNGSASVTAGGGVGPYTYSWSNGPATQAITGVAANTYICTVTDANGCTKTIPVSINNLAGPSLTISNVVNVSCFGGTNGQATVSAIGGTLPYSYLWSNGSTVPTATNLAAGTYGVTVTDATNCSSSSSVVIVEPTQLVVNPSFVNPTCNGFCDGTASVTAAGGTGPYSYAWTPGTNTTPSISGLCFGTYSCIVTDSQGCSVTENVILTSPAIITASAVSTPVSCFGICDGTATVNVVNGGTGPYSYVWSPSGQTSSTATGLCAGNYTVSIQDANGCPSTATVSISTPTAMVSSISGGNATCFGICNGFAQITVSGGTGAYTYSWSPNVNASSSVNNLCAGNYSVTATDNNGCSVTENVIITQPQPLVANMTQTNVTCNGACDGSATAVIDGGTGPYTFIWTPTLQTTNNVINLCAGVYNLNVVDSSGCVVASSVTITEPTLLQLTTSTTPANCGQSNGSAGVAIIGGVGPYVYQWNDSLTQTSATASNLYANSYTITVTDAMGCSQVATANVNNLNGPTVAIVATTNPTCDGANNGTAITSISGGAIPYTISWNNPTLPASSNQTGLDGGNYTITVTDNAGCVTSGSFALTEPDPLVALVTTAVNPSCYLTCDGSGTASVVGGTGPYTYTWNSNPVQNTASATGLCDGTYTITVNDVNGCSTTTTKNFVAPSQIAINAVVVNNVSCSGGSNGSIVLSVSGGTPGYVYTWTPLVSTGVVASGLANGNYGVVVTDSRGCTNNASYTITEPPPLSVSLAVTPSTCGLANGTSTATVSGGQTPYNISWNPTTQTGATATNLAAGQYNIYITDGGQCQFDTLINIINIPGPSAATETHTNLLCNGIPTGTATATAVGGTAPYTYSWTTTPLQTSQTANGLSAGNYSVTITDDNGCQISIPVVINQPQPVFVVGANDITLCYGQLTQVYATAGGGTGNNYTYSWNPTTTWTGPGPYNVNTTATTIYTVIATDGNGCVSPQDNITVTVLPPLSISTNNIGVCEGQPATLSSTASGGNGGPYNIQWCNGGTSLTTNITVPVGQTTYSCDVILSDGCSNPDTATAVITVNPSPLALMSVNDPDGCEPHTTSFVGSSTNGTSYQWSFGDGGSSNSMISTHVYANDGVYDVSLTVTSAQGCSTTITNPAFVTVFPAPDAAFTASPGETTILSPQVSFTNQTSNGEFYQWNFGVTSTESDTSNMFSPQYTYTDTGHYAVTLIAVNSLGCVDTIRQIVWVKPDYVFYAPNAFTPNGDGLNDIFTPVVVGAKTLQLSIFDRWGELIYEGERGWDGTKQGNNVKCDVYIWKAKTVDLLGVQRNDYMGRVTVVR